MLAIIQKNLTLSVLAFSSIAFISSCDSIKSNKDETHAVKTEVVDGKFCFMKVSGMQGKDTLLVSLDIRDQQVIGRMNDKIFEKDARIGTLEGELEGKTIKAVWTFQQEGMTDTLNVEFELDSNQLLQRPFMVDKTSGRQQTDYSSSDWIKIPTVDCVETGKDFAFTVSGIVQDIIQGKDGYMANLLGNDGKQYSIMMSIINLQKNYQKLNTGDHVQVSGDTIRLGEKIQVQVKQFSKK